MELANKCVVLLMLILSLFHKIFTDESVDGLLRGPTITAVVGSRTLLPCSMESDDANDRPILILFYQGAAGTPVYSLDARNGPSIIRSEWIDEKLLGNRASFLMDSYPQGLWINPVEQADDALYRCRVDFQKSPTRNILIELRVIVPAKSVIISDGKGNIVSEVTELYKYGTEVVLICTVNGGKPRPDVSWWRNGQFIAETSEKLKSSFTINTLSILNVQRHDFMAEFKCKASNNNGLLYIEDTVRLNMTLPPLEVAIRGNYHKIREGKTVTFFCESFGAYPYSQITWWKEGFSLKGSIIKVDRINNRTQSSVSITAEKKDANTRITCRTENPFMDSGVLESSTKLSVLYRPSLTLKPGLSIDPDKLEEGDDVYIECVIDANPKVNEVRWFHNEVEIFHNASIGIIQSNQSLALQKVNRNLTGNYVCLAANSEGYEKSNSLFVSIKFKPFCLTGQQLVYGAEKHEPVNATCGVSANPPPSTFVWAFNTSSDIVELKDNGIIDGKHITYKAETDLQFGTLLCWGVNEVGKQEVPCVFHIIHSVIPEPVSNCSASNITHSSAFITCLRGWDGGIKQSFSLKIIDGEQKLSYGFDHSPRVLAKTTAKSSPQFTLVDLVENTHYTASVYSTNKKGKSISKRIFFQTATNTLSAAKEIEIEDQIKQFPSVIIISIMSSLITTIAAVFCYIYVKRKNDSQYGCFHPITKFAKSADISRSVFSEEVVVKGDNKNITSKDHDFLTMGGMKNPKDKTAKTGVVSSQITASADRFETDLMLNERESFFHSSNVESEVDYSQNYQTLDNKQCDGQPSVIKSRTLSPHMKQAHIINRGLVDELRKDKDIIEELSPSRQSPTTVKLSSKFCDRESAV